MPSHQKIAEQVLESNPSIVGLAALRLKATEDKDISIANSLSGLLHSTVSKACRSYPDDVHGIVAAMARKRAKDGDVPDYSIEAAFTRIGDLIDSPEQLKWKESYEAKQETPPKNYEKAVKEVIKAEAEGEIVRPIVIDTINFNFPTRKPLLREKYGWHSWYPEKKEEQRTDY